MAMAFSLTTEFATKGAYTIDRTSVHMSCTDALLRVGEYTADYSELTSEEIAATDPVLEQLLAHSKVVSSKRL